MATELGTVLAILQHPLVVLFCGALSTAYFAPLLVHRSALGKSRLEKALTLIERGAVTSRHINALLTALELFHKDRSQESGESLDLPTEQARVRERMVGLYLDFDREAWGWYWDIHALAKLLELDTDEITRVDELAEAYLHALVKTTEVIDGLWTQLLRKNYEPNDEANQVTLEATRRTVRSLEGTRRDSLAKVAAIISPAFLARTPSAR